jgi:hypothetical protein
MKIMKTFIFKNYGYKHIRKDYDYMSIYKNDLKTKMLQNKPCGLWGSPIKSSYSWKNFCEGNDFNTWCLEIENTVCIDSSNCLYIQSKKDLRKLDPFLIKNKFSTYPKYVIDWNRIMHKYDGIIIYISNISDMFNLSIDEYGLSCWDVDSVCIWNLDKILYTKQKIRKERKSFRQ